MAGALCYVNALRRDFRSIKDAYWTRPACQILTTIQMITGKHKTLPNLRALRLALVRPDGLLRPRGFL